MARDLDVSCKILTRRLIRYLLDGKISWADMFTRYKDLAVADAPDSRRKAQMRTTLPPEQYAAFAQLAESWGSTTPTVIRRLILLYVTGKIGRRDIW